MSRKKSRKVGLIGIRSVPKDQRKVDTTPGKPKKKVGNPSGSRHSVKVETNKQVGQQNKDPRLGSKKAVPLIVEEKRQPKLKTKYFSPKQELEAIENDEALAALLDKIDNSQPLSAEQQKYVDEKLSRHKTLCELLGISEEKDSEAEDVPTANDPLERFEAIDPDKLK